MNKEVNFKLENIIARAMTNRVDDVSPSFRRKTTLTNEQIEKIIQTISLNLDLAPEKILIGMYLLFLQGAASSSSPLNMSVEIGSDKFLEKKNVVDACNLVAGHRYIRRIAETLATEIGNFAYHNKLTGELGYRVNNKLKAETGESLNEKEIAFCNSFSQIIPNLSEITSERLAKLLAEDYQKRFEFKKKQKNVDNMGQNLQNGKKKNRKKK